MKVSRTQLPEVLLIEPTVFEDARGFFLETYNENRYRIAGIDGPFLQDNLSRSGRGVLRGLHLQHPHGQGKLVQVLQGEVYDVAADVRRGSPTFGRWIGEYLSASNKRQLFIPPGFAHGFMVTSDVALFHYKCTEYYRAESEVSVRWDDPALGIEWPAGNCVLSDKDRTASLLRDLPNERLPLYSR